MLLGRFDLKTDQMFGCWYLARMSDASSLRRRKARMSFSEVGHVTYDVPTFIF